MKTGRSGKGWGGDGVAGSARRGDHTRCAASVGGMRSRDASTYAVRTAAGDRAEPAAIREWARKQGMVVADRGRIPAEVRERHEQAGSPALARG